MYFLAEGIYSEVLLGSLLNGLRALLGKERQHLKMSKFSTWNTSCQNARLLFGQAIAEMSQRISSTSASLDFYRADLDLENPECGINAFILKVNAFKRVRRLRSRLRLVDFFF